MKRLILLSVTLSFVAGCVSTKPGPPPVPESFRGDELVIAVLSEGYTRRERVQFEKKVQELFVNGVNGLLTTPFYMENASRFRIRPIFFRSRDAGVSVPGRKRKTAFGVVFHGEPSRCNFDIAPGVHLRVRNALRNVPHDFVVVLSRVVDGQYKKTAGCVPEGSRTVFVTDVSQPTVIGHELGHSIAALMEERGGFAGAPPRRITKGNCSTVCDRAQVHWHDYITDASTTCPTPIDGVHLDKVALYRGCALYSLDVFRPTNQCRMGSGFFNDFCPICKPLMIKALDERQAVGPGDRVYRLSFAVPSGPNPRRTYLSSELELVPTGRLLPAPVGNGAWALRIGSRTVAATAIDTEPSANAQWRSYSDVKGEEETVVDGDYRIVDLFVTAEALKNVPPGAEDVRLELYELPPYTQWKTFSVPDLPAEPLVSVQSPLLGQAISIAR